MDGGMRRAAHPRTDARPFTVYPERSQNSTDAVGSTTECREIGDLRTLRRVQRVDDHAIANIDGSMVGIRDDVARLGLGEARNGGSDTGLGARGARQINAEPGEDIPDESSAIPAARSGATRYIGGRR